MSGLQRKIDRRSRLESLQIRTFFMPRPWYRSHLFLLGIPGLVFLIWCWFAYIRKPTSLCFGTANRLYCLGWGDSVVELATFERDTNDRNTSEELPMGFHVVEEPWFSEENVRVIAPAFWIRSNDRWGSQSCFGVGHWVIVVTYALSWLGGLIWWQRRKHLLVEARIRSPQTRAG